MCKAHGPTATGGPTDSTLLYFCTYIGGMIFSSKCTIKRLAAGLGPDPLGELKRSPDPLAAIRGSYF